MIARLLSNSRVQTLCRIAAACSWLTLAVLSLVSGSERPHTGMSGNIEHMMAYFLAFLVTRLAWRRTASRWQLDV